MGLRSPYLQLHALFRQVLLSGMNLGFRFGLSNIALCRELKWLCSQQ